MTDKKDDSDQLSLFGSQSVIDVTHAKEFETPTVYDHLPDGWIVKLTAQTNPIGYVWICNNKPMFDDKYEHGLMKIEYLPERNGMHR